MKLARVFSITVVWLLLFLGPAWAADYVSLHHYEQAKTFCSQSTGLGGSYETDKYPCITDPYIYKYTRTLQGYKDLYDLNDPKILCGMDYTDAAQCDTTVKYMSFTLTSLDRGNGRDVSSFPDGFRIFIPPGTLSAAVTLFFPIDAKEGVIVRYKGAPDSTYLAYANDLAHYTDVPWDSDSDVNLAVLQQRDVYLRNTGGHAYALPGDYAPTPEDSGWLYIRKLPFTSDRIHDVKVTLKVDVATYMEWYNNVQPAGTDGCVDSNNAQTGDLYCWDAGGDPWSEGAYVQPVTSCSPSNLDGCIDEGGCAGAGGFWYNNTCNADPFCDANTLVNCTDEDTCEGSGFYYYDGACNAGPQCDEGDPSQCTSQNTCEDSGFFWYNDACNVTPPCSADHLEVCDTEPDCIGAGGSWDTSQSPPQCVSACGPDSLAACTSGSLCSYYGGSWDASTSTCGESSGSTYTPPPPSTDTGSQCTGTPFDAFIPGCGGGVPTASEDTCDASHLELCQSEQECNSAGGYMDGSTCKPVETAPANQEDPEDLSSDPESAPIALVDGAADDGVVVPGENMHLKFHFPGYGSPVDAYAALQFPGAGDQLFYFQDDSNTPLVAQFHAFRRSFRGSLNKQIYEDFDACSAFGNAYDGPWYVYLLIIPAEEGRSFTSVDELWRFIEDNDVPYRLKWYRLNVQCGDE